LIFDVCVLYVNQCFEGGVSALSASSLKNPFFLVYQETDFFLPVLPVLPVLPELLRLDPIFLGTKPDTSQA
jgi:hypothetical protein